MRQTVEAKDIKVRDVIRDEHELPYIVTWVDVNDEDVVVTFDTGDTDTYVPVTLVIIERDTAEEQDNGN